MGPVGLCRLQWTGLVRLRVNSGWFGVDSGWIGIPFGLGWIALDRVGSRWIALDRVGSWVFRLFWFFLVSLGSTTRLLMCNIQDTHLPMRWILWRDVEVEA